MIRQEHPVQDFLNYKAAYICTSWNVMFCLGLSDGVSAISVHKGLRVWSCLDLRCSIILKCTVFYLENSGLRSCSEDKKPNMLFRSYPSFGAVL